MKFKIIIECEDDFEKDAIMDAVKNKLLIDEVYSSVFRSVIKYSENEKEVEAYGMVWSKLQEYLSGNE